MSRYAQIYCDGEWTRAWPEFRGGVPAFWRCERCGKHLNLVQTHSGDLPSDAGEIIRFPSASSA